jgi:hypothetical protein
MLCFLGLFCRETAAMTTPFHDAQEPITTRVVVRTAFETWMSWEHARMIDPLGMEHATFLHATRYEDGTVDVTLEVAQQDLDYLVAAVGEEYALSALEDSISCDASEITQAADLEEAVRLIPTTNLVPPSGANTFAVTWSASEAVMILEAIQEAENELRLVRLARMGRDGDKLLLVVTLPPHLADEVRAEGVTKSEAGFPDGVLPKLLSILNDGETAFSEGSCWSDDGNIPF